MDIILVGIVFVVFEMMDKIVIEGVEVVVFLVGYFRDIEVFLLIEVDGILVGIEE